ncbi:Fe-S cluster assembly protein SufD [Chromatium okenii]|uniref:Fe-S cluster assembly protein SufD n=1 Tax=Chromatium okenii TaxID=61644 RepID=UPI0019073B6E|nr:Fe-S cluster assembly protein SufD [Chromatium okenii]MBK1641357.1 Fe-S cluster assembly protein SufD [Chromatium okenii]
MTDHALMSWLPQLAPAAPAWLATLQAAARAQVQTQIAAPDAEAWRYTSLNHLLEQGFVPIDETITALQPDDLDEVLIPGLASRRVVFVNGRYAPELSATEALPPGVHLDSLRDVLAHDPDAVRVLLTAEPATVPLFMALNLAGLDDGLVLRLDRAAILAQPLELIHLSIGLDQPSVAQPHHLIVLGDGAQATLVERYVSLGAAVYCTNAVIEIQLGRDAVLTHERLQTESQNAFHLSGLSLRQDANSRYQSVNLGLGSRWSRTELLTQFCAAHAECDLRGLYLAGDDQRIDYHLDVNHAVPNCTSRETFKGIIYGKGRAVFDGRVVVAKDAQKSDAAMSNQNLLLSPQAEIDTKPQLEINADDVRCSHGTTVGQIEPEKLFYLRSRGISAALARRMLCLGFADEIIHTLHSETLREHLSEQVGQRLESAPWD